MRPRGGLARRSSRTAAMNAGRRAHHARVKRRGVASSRSGRVKQASFARASEGGSKASHARDAVTAAGTRARRAAPNRIRHATAGCVCPSRRSNGHRRSAGAARLAGPPVTEDAPAPLMRRGNVTADGGHDAARYSMGGLAESACDGERAPWDVVVVVVVVVARRAASGKRQAASGKRSARIERVPLCATHRSTHGIAPDDGNRDRVGCMNAVTRAWSLVTAAVTIRE
ncbi:AraC family transcriptional regulator [Burkholderia pseudomallei]|nr:AraC family transcriptional regulator [Burkholderia pseudomallei]CAJ6421089.1 AraC family transcriptional regulator [Burkholderia pseudomallei]CAJ6547124.1 AraC family transcriptional regulator [Burkholderia pseudomallei]CAJ7940932.1 AraC family transcriptional regulator [Burkholderia pseudomallei]CAJ8711990.1 AraC family transcriptional regulator [Burkholderia pseudomallei]